MDRDEMVRIGYDKCDPNEWSEMFGAIDCSVVRPDLVDDKGVMLRKGEPVMRTIQSGKDESDINVIVGRFLKTGVLPDSIAMPPLSEDFTEFTGDFQDLQNVVRAGLESFQMLSAEVRAEFFNDPARFVAYCEDERNLPRLRELGLAVPALVVPESSVPGSGESVK